jgi:GNAT superfamily N-acetyltransferase
VDRLILILKRIAVPFLFIVIEIVAISRYSSATSFTRARLLSVSNGVTDAYIQDLMVHPDYQGQGIGTELMNRMIAYLKTHHIYMISVIYEPALSSFYRRFGFFEMLSGQLETFKCE